jgi:Zn-finger nucleic acid-binding protein
MRSPVDPKATLQRTEIRPGLTAFVCPSSSGCWIEGETYWNWLRAQPEFPALSASSDGPSAELETDTDRALLSPRSGRLMRRFRVGSGLGFHVEYDSLTPGFWLDAGEYHALEQRSLHDELHLICTAQYQKTLREAEREGRLRDRQRDRFGDADWARLQETAAWLRGLDEPRVALAILAELTDDADTD